MSIFLNKCEITQQCKYHENIKDNKSLNSFLYLLTTQYKSIKECVGIIHDKDTNKDGTPKESHFHIFVKLGTSQDIEWIAKIFKVEVQYIEKIKGSFKDCLAYAIHLNAPDKYQYDKNELSLYGMTMDNYDKEISNIDIDDKIIKQALYDYGNLKLSKRELFDKFINDSAIYQKYDKLFKKMQDYRMFKGRERDMQVIYVCGASGTGKTTFGKWLAYKYHFDYFVSGSGADFLDGYDKEECIILDDFRDNLLTPSELFKLTDNNTNSSVKSRFRNKDISNCKLLIITCINHPQVLYNNWQQDIKEPFFQFARRLKFVYFNIMEDNITSIKLDERHPEDTTKNKITLAPYNMQLVFKELNIIRKQDDIATQIFNLGSEK